MEEIMIRTEDGVRVSVDPWSPSAIWLHLGSPNRAASAVLTRSEAKQVIAALQAQLAAIA
jgi:hypothetical protein